MHPFLCSISFFFIFLLLIFNLPLSMSQSEVEVDFRFSTCSQHFDCGTLKNISYPFWGRSRPDYCGHPNFKLECPENDDPVITIIDRKYRVLAINENDQMLLIARTDSWNGDCPVAPMFNTTIDTRLFTYPTPVTQYLTLAFGCSSIGREVGGKDFICNISGSPMVGFSSWSDPASLYPKLLGCSTPITIPVLSTAASPNPSVEDVLKQGFQVKYDVDAEECKECEKSDGQCGFNRITGGLQCICRHGPNKRTCSRDHKEKKKVMKILIITVIFGLVTIGVLTYISLRWTAKRSEKKKKKKDIEILLDKSGNISEFRDNQELPFFNLKKLATATNNFDAANKLGQGGFGPVYKGKLPNGQEIGVKRFSRSSGQGIGEFKNEVVLISKLQHRNLVRLLGYCMEGQERMLIYEYMPNKSLDAFIFDPTKRVLLDWRKRFEIIMGICQGIIYLHRDSRLRVIHRDLKASNILLDQELNPKISDFGMARIFGGDELQANTMRVVGTYGYMSPEYAMEGRFSEKSDVFSFGVLLLEIVSGKRNTSFYHHKQSWSLLGYAWKLWNEGKIQELIDPVTSESSFQEEILRCIHVGLLCVQDFAQDRPTMSSIVSMLLSEITSLPTPKQPAFTGGRVEPDLDLCQDTIFSNNNVSITVIGGR